MRPVAAPRRGRRSRSPARPRRGGRHGLQPRRELDELAAGEEVVDRLVLGHVADPAVDRVVAADGLAEHAHRSLRRRDQAGDRAQQRRLARAVRPEQRRHARARPTSVTSLTATTPPNQRDRRVDRDRRRGRAGAHPRTIRSRAAQQPARRARPSGPTSQSAETQPGPTRPSTLVAEDPVHRVHDHLQEVGQREHVRERPVEVVLPDARRSRRRSKSTANVPIAA